MFHVFDADRLLSDHHLPFFHEGQQQRYRSSKTDSLSIIFIICTARQTPDGMFKYFHIIMAQIAKVIEMRNEFECLGYWPSECVEEIIGQLWDRSACFCVREDIRHQM